MRAINLPSGYSSWVRGISGAGLITASTSPLCTPRKSRRSRSTPTTRYFSSKMSNLPTLGWMLVGKGAMPAQKQFLLITKSLFASRA